MELKRVDETEYERDRYAEPGDEVFEYIRRNPINEEQRQNHNVLFLKRALWSRDVHVREMLGYLLAKKCGIPVCETELAIYPTIGDRYENAVISYAEASKYDTTLLPISCLRDYRRRIGLPIQPNDYMLDLEGVFNVVFSMMQENNRPLSEFDEFTQDFIDMMVYDIAFVNSDRDNKNWLLRRDNRDGKIDLYPLFDNASIFATENEYDKEIDNDEAYSLSESHPLQILTPTDFMLGLRESRYDDMLKYLFQKYPVHTDRAFEKINKVDEIVLEELIDSIPGVDHFRKDQMIKVFRLRKSGIELCRQLYRKKDKELIKEKS